MTWSMPTKQLLEQRTIQFLGLPRGFGLSDYITPNIQALAFPTLFPYGDGHGDVTNGDRRVAVSFHNATSHLLKYAVYDKGCIVLLHRLQCICKRTIKIGTLGRTSFKRLQRIKGPRNSEASWDE
jgi:hypothetical protein